MESAFFASRKAFPRIVSTITVAITAFLLLSASSSAQVKWAPVITTAAGGGSLCNPSALGDGCPAFQANLNQPQGVAVDSAGNFYIADTLNNRIREVDASTGVITTVAGNGTAGYSGDGGRATSAELNGPSGVAVDGAGNLYVADTLNNRIREVDASTGIISTVVGTTPAGQPILSSPFGVAVDGLGNLYTADRGNNRIFELDVSHRQLTIVAGNGAAGFSGDDGAATSAELNSPYGVAVDGAGNLYIADTGNNRIREVDAATGIITTVVGTGGGYSGDGGLAMLAQLYFPLGVALDGLGNLYIADSGNDRIREVDASTGIITTVAGGGLLMRVDGVVPTSVELLPSGVALDSAGNLYIADSGFSVIEEVESVTGSALLPTTPVGSGYSQSVLVQPAAGQTVRSVTANTSQGGVHEYSVSLGRCPWLGFGTLCEVWVTFTPAFPGKRDVALKVTTNTGTYFLGMSGIGTGPETALIPGTITTVAGDGSTGFFSGGGTLTSTRVGLNVPESVAVDSAGNFYIADTLDSYILKVNASTGVITTVAGNGTAGYSGDGGAATSAELNSPSGVAVDGAGNLYIADTLNNRIREVDAATGIITTVVGNGTSGYSGDGSWLSFGFVVGVPTSAELSEPAGVAVDSAGNLYIADYGNHVIREVNASTGSISTVAGNGTAGYFGDGGAATSAELSGPTGVALDSTGNLYVADSANNCIRKVNRLTGVISTVAGNGTAGYSGDGGVATRAELSGPTGVATDSAGNVYIADHGNNRIRAVNALTGVVTTVAGDGTASFSGDNGPATSAELNAPTGVTLDSAGNLYIADTLNFRIREVNVSSTPNLSFAATSVGSQSSDSPKTVILENIGNEPLTFAIPGMGTNPSVAANFALDAGTTTCPQLTASSSASMLGSGAGCALGVDFVPTAAGAINGSVVVTDDNLNKIGSMQSIGLSGSGASIASSTVTIICPPSVTYNGSAQTPCTAIVTGTGGLNQSLTVMYSNNTNAGPATASASYPGDTNYSASSNTANFTISPAPVTATAGTYSGTFDGSTHSPSMCQVTGAYTGGLTCTNSPSSVGPDVSSGTVQPSFGGTGTNPNFSITNVPGSWTISPAPVMATGGSYTGSYDGAPHSPSACQVTGAYTVGLTCTNSPSSVGPDVGTGPVAPTIGGTASTTNFTINSVPSNWTISAALVTATAGNYSGTYDGSIHSPSTCILTGSYTGTLSCSNNPSSVGPDAGSGPVAPVVGLPTGPADFTITPVPGAWKIGQAPVTVTINCPANLSFNGTPQTPCSATVTGAGLSQPLQVQYANNSNAGMATASASFGGDPNHAPASNSTTFNIAPAMVTAQAGSYTGTFDGNPHAVSPCKLTGSYTVGLTCTDNPASVGPGVSSGTVTPVVNGGNGNFSISPVRGNYSITSAPAVATLTVTTDKGLNASGVPYVQYSDAVSFNLNISPVLVTSPLTSGTNCGAGNAYCVSVQIGTQTFGPIALTNNGTALVGSLTNQQVFLVPGSYSVSLLFGNGTNGLSQVNSSYALVSVIQPSGSSTPSANFSVTQEDAQVSYTGPSYIKTTSSSTSVTVTYTLMDATATGTASSIYDAWPGNITQANVSFALTNGSSTVIGTCTPSIVAVSGAVATSQMGALPSSATASCTFNNVPVPGTYYVSASPGAGSFYLVSSGDVVVPITTATGGTGFITGGGYQTATYLEQAGPSGSNKYMASGLLQPAAGTKISFGFEAKYQASNNNLQGGVNLVIRSTCLSTPVSGYTPKPLPGNICVYQFKVPQGQLTSLSETLSPTSKYPWAQLVGGANIYDVTWRNNIQQVANSKTAILQIQMYDVGDPGPGVNVDPLSIQVSDSTYGLWFSNNWSGSKTVLSLAGVTSPTATSTTGPLIQGGNLQVH